jgi:hypothetical protein
MILIHNYKIYVTDMTCNPNNTKRWVQRVVQHTQHILTISYKKNIQLFIWWTTCIRTVKILF